MCSPSLPLLRSAPVARSRLTSAFFFSSSSALLTRDSLTPLLVIIFFFFYLPILSSTSPTRYFVFTTLADLFLAGSSGIIALVNVALIYAMRKVTTPWLVTD